MPLASEVLPYEFRHLEALFLTMDGNHQANRFARNTDRRDTALWGGLGYFPPSVDYKSHVTGTDTETEKSVCNNITAVNAQNRKKFQWQDETGVINVQCNHVFVVSSVDMYYGERYAVSYATL